jgi:hypothetical protein
MKDHFWRDRRFLLLAGALLSLFILRTLLAMKTHPPRFNDLFTATAVVSSLGLLLTNYHTLRRNDWIAAIVLGSVVGTGMVFATLFSAYPFWGVVQSNLGQAFVRGIGTTLAALGGLVVMRQGGPVQFRTPNLEWRKVGVSLVLGLAIGLPLAILNVFALQLTQGKSIIWQSLPAALLDALQPGIVEEVIYRFALLGVFWLVLRKSIPEQATWLSGLLALLAHTFMHFDDLFVQAPLVALGMGLALAIIWGLPLTILALRRDLESAMAFHWIQDVARFLAGF